jgi:hypothetical protein
MGEKQGQPFQFSFNASLKVDFQGSRVTSDGGLILVRELEERLGFGDLITQHLTDSRKGKNTQLPLADLLRQSVCSRIAGYEDVNDAERLSQDPTFRLTGSEKMWDRGAALTSRLQTFETEMLAEDESLCSLARSNRELIAKAEAIDAQHRIVLDMDSSEIPVFGQQENSGYNGHFESTCYHPLLVFNREGDGLAAKLRPGNVHRAGDWDELLLPEIERQRKLGKEVVFRAEPQASGLVQGLSSSGSELEDGAARGGQDRVPLRGTAPARGVHCDQPGDGQPCSVAVLQQAGDGGALDRGRQAGGQDDAAELPSAPVE